jgi:hypothetical protein
MKAIITYGKSTIELDQLEQACHVAAALAATGSDRVELYVDFSAGKEPKETIRQTKKRRKKQRKKNPNSWTQKILTLLQHCPNQSFTTAEVAKQVELPLETASKLLSALRSNKEISGERNGQSPMYRWQKR